MQNINLQMQNINQGLTKMQLHVSELKNKSHSKANEFIIKFIIDLFFIFLLYVYETLKEAYKDMKEQLTKKEWVKAFYTLVVYFFDLFLPFSVLLLTKKVVWGIFDPTLRDIYFQWCTDCYIFFLSFILLHTYLYTFLVISKEQFRVSVEYFYSHHHLQTLGLGKIKESLLLKPTQDVADFLVNLQSVTIQEGNAIHESFAPSQNIHREENYFKEKVIIPITEDLNIEPTFLRFRLYDDQDTSIQVEGVAQVQVNLVQADLTKHILFNDSRNLHDQLLLILYQKRDILAQEGKQSQRVLSITVYLILKKKQRQDGHSFIQSWQIQQPLIQLYALLVITGFYVYIISFLFLIFDNEDLKRRTFINQQLASFIEFSKDEDEESKKLKFDITCILSLHCWNNARKISYEIDREKSEKYEVSYVFLGIYLIFLMIILVQIFLDIKMFIHQDSVFYQPLIMMNMTLDAFIISFIFICRIYFGDQFNQSLEHYLETLEDLLESYESLFNLRGYFFEKDLMRQLQNSYYKKLVSKLDEKVQLSLMGMSITKFNQAKMREDLIEQVIFQLKSIKKQVVVDIQKQKHRFLGWFESDFTALMQTLFIGFLSVAPTLLDQIWKLV